MTKRGLTPQERFWRYVDKDGPLFDGEPCWLWTGSCNNAGYGQIRVAGQTVMAHRLSYEWHVAPIYGATIDHRCRVRNCVNPAHLEPCSQRENNLRSPFTQAARNAAKTHCPQGHEYTPENTYVHPRTRGRNCRTCQRERRRRAA